MIETLVERARVFALKAHEGIVRPNKAQEPYSTHIKEVAELVEQSGGSQDEIAAAWLHDTIEDTKTTLDDIQREFGETVATIVDGLTDKPDLQGMPTFARKQLQAERVRTKNDSVKQVKIADQTSNVRSVAIDPPVTWDKQKCLDYVNGALVIVEECKTVSPFLYSEFVKAHKEAVAAHS